MAGGGARAFAGARSRYCIQQYNSVCPLRDRAGAWRWPISAGQSRANGSPAILAKDKITRGSTLRLTHLVSTPGSSIHRQHGASTKNRKSRKTDMGNQWRSPPRGHSPSMASEQWRPSIPRFWKDATFRGGAGARAALIRTRAACRCSEPSNCAACTLQPVLHVRAPSASQLNPENRPWRLP